MSDEIKVIHESKAARFVVQRRLGIDWIDDEAFPDPDDAIDYSDRRASRSVGSAYRVVDTGSGE